MDRLQQLDLFAPAIAAAGQYDVAVTPEVSEWLAAGAVCALGVSGGKDSQAMAIRLAEYLDQIGHQGPRVLIHSDLGVVEWKDSLPVCERLAKRLGWDLIVLRRSAGDMMDRWEARWASSLERYSTLSCVKIILPWSTPGMSRCLTPHHLQIAPHCVADSHHAVFPVWCGDVISSLQILNRFSKRTQPGLGSAKPNEPGDKRA